MWDGSARSGAIAELGGHLAEIGVQKPNHTTWQRNLGSASYPPPSRSRRSTRGRLGPHLQEPGHVSHGRRQVSFCATRSDEAAISVRLWS